MTDARPLPDTTDIAPIEPVRRLILHKHALEHEMNISREGAWTLRAWRQGLGIGPASSRVARVALNPWRYLHACVGHLAPPAEMAHGAVQSVPAWRVIGGCYTRRRNRSDDPGWVMRRTAAIAADHRDTRGQHPELIRLSHIPALGIYLTRNGHKRISLYQRYHRPIPALIDARIEIPPPEALSLVHNRPGDTWQLEYTPAGRLHTIPFPDSVVPLLRAYGVGERTRIHWMPALILRLQQGRTRRAASGLGIQMRP